MPKRTVQVLNSEGGSVFRRADLELTYREQIQNKPYTLKRFVDGRFVPWAKDAKFPPHRFNPDKIPAPTIPGMIDRHLR